MAQHRYHRKDIITPYFYDIIAILNTNYSNRNHRQGRQSLSTLAGDSFNLYRFPRFPFSSSGLPLPLPSSFSRFASAISAFISTINTFSFSSHSSRVWA